MKGYDWEGGQFRIVNGDRIVATTGGTLLQFLTTEQTFTANIDFPNVNKTQIYQFQYSIQYAGLSNFFAIRKARSVVGALPQEWSDTVVLGAAPAGADMFVGRVALSRTISPSHTWRGSGIPTLVPTGQYIQATGTFLVEAALGISRAMTIDVQGGNLVARLQHSVGPAAGNFRTSGVWPPVWPGSIGTNHGAENIAVSGDGIPVWWTDTAPYYLDQGQAFVGTTPSPAAWVGRARYGGAEQVSYTDPTTYATRYAITVKGRFGRRS